MAAALVAAGAVLEGLSLVLLVPLLGIVIGSGSVIGWLGVERPFVQLTLLLVIFGTLMILRAAVMYWRDVTVAQLQTGFVESQRLRIAESLAGAPWEQVARLRHARITQLLGGDIQRIGTAAFTLLRCLVAGSMLLAQCILVFLLAPVLAGLAVIVLAVGALLFVPVVRRAREYGAALTGSNLSLLNTAAQFLGGLKLAISQNLQSRFVDEFRQNLQTLTARQIEFTRRETGRRMVLSAISALACGALILAGFGLFDVAPARLITLLLIVARMSGPAGQIQQGATQLAQALPVYANVKALERELNAAAPVRSIETSTLVQGPIVFDNVSFSHPDGGGLHEFSLAINPGECIGISGPSGAGKTTFADLLVGMFPPQQGSITAGGVLLQGATLTAWRASLSYVSQDPYLFHDTIRRNLVWANAQVSEAEMWQALELAGAAALVRGMEKGLDTIVGERGTLMSGGERQRIALAGAILRQPRLLVLDEATSAIDVAGEREILRRLRALEPRPTIVIIAHRTESLALCDRVIRLEAQAGD